MYSGHSFLVMGINTHDSHDVMGMPRDKNPVMGMPCHGYAGEGDGTKKGGRRRRKGREENGAAREARKEASGKGEGLNVT